MRLKYGSYSEKNLVRYDEVIRLFFEETGKYAWLELKNYKDVLFDGSPDEVVEDAIVLGYKKESTKISLKPANIGLLLDPQDVIKFQRAVLPLRASREDVENETTRRYIDRVLATGLEAVGADCNESIVDARDFGSEDFARRALLRIIKALQKREEPIGRGDSVHKEIEQFARLGFTGYFPKPSLIREEERTTLRESGKTSPWDPRRLTHVPSSHAVPPKNALDLYIDTIDQDLERALVANGIIVEKNTDRERDQNPKAKDLSRNLHAGLKRVNCFAFRGEVRHPLSIERANGFLPGITRTDDDAMSGRFLGGSVPVASAREVADAIDSALAKAKPRQGNRSKVKSAKGEDIVSYLEALKKFNMLHLDRYIKDQSFRCYLSTTKSIAIAKCFINYWKGPPLLGWCYAMHCHGGYEIPSHSEGILDDQGKLNISTADLQKLHNFANAFEQEVAVAGAIWWDHVTGFRLVDCTDNGQFFAGPVYLREERYWKVKQEEHAFNALFELLSGKSQGKHSEIFKSYKKEDGKSASDWSLEPNAADKPPDS